MTYNISPDELPPPPPDTDAPLPGIPGRKLDKLDIDEDLACVHCQYNLKGLTKKHRCPECGTPAGFSVQGDLLLYAPVPWLKTVSLGMVLMLWAIGVALPSHLNFMVMPGLGMLLGLVGAGLAWTGAMFVTTPEPRMVAAASGFDLRKSIRLLATLKLGCALLVIFSTSGKFTAIMWALSMLLLFAMLLPLTAFLGKLSARLPECDFERWTTQVFWGLAISLGVWFTFGGFSLVFAGAANVTGPAPCVASIAAMSACFFACWFGLLLYRFYGLMKWAAHEAESQFEPPPVRDLDLEDATEDWNNVRD